MTYRTLKLVLHGIFMSLLLHAPLANANTAPTAVDDQLQRLNNSVARVPVSILLANDFDPDGDAISFNSVSPTSFEGGSVTVSAGWIFYTPPAHDPASDIFTYTITDGQAVSAEGWVQVTEIPDPGPPDLTLLDLGTGSYRISFQGAPWWNYTVEYKSALTEPVWQVLGVGVADADGHFEFDDVLPGAGVRFYRVVDYGNASASVFQVAVASSANPSLPGVPVTFSAAVTSILPGGDPATGFVQFKLDGENFGDPAPVVNNVASITTNGFPVGLYTVTAHHTDPGSGEVAVGLLYPLQLVNTPPLVVGESLLYGSQGTKVSVGQILSNDSDADGDALTLDGVDTVSANGGAIQVAGGWVYYTPPLGPLLDDSFAYTVADGRGDPVAGTVAVMPPVSTAPSANLTAVNLGDGRYHLFFDGIPWRRYTIEYADAGTGNEWTLLALQDANALGHFVYEDGPVGGVRSYRVLDELAGPIASPFRNAVWTNFIASTNGRTIDMWVERSRTNVSYPPLLSWNTNCLLYGLEGYTGISQWNEWQASPGQSPVTLLTPRHGYMRGHGQSAPGFHNDVLTGKKVWFADTNDQVVGMTVAAEYIRLETLGGVYYDYSLVIFSNDVPPSLTPLSVMSAADFETYYYDTPEIPFLFYVTEQAGHCLAGYEVPEFWYEPGFTKGGDSGSPNMIPSPDGKLVFFRGTGTSPASQQMQADMDFLSGYMGLNTNDYQLQWYQPLPAAP